MWPTPPPCPVDDAPHTTCTSPDYHSPVVIVQLPCRDAAVQEGLQTPPLPAPAAGPTDTSFTTATYQRRLHRSKVAP